MNPLLRHFGMIGHPPTTYLGFTGFVIPFSFAIAALITGKSTGDQWIRTTRRWTLVAWIFLSIGLVLGGRWAYDVLGWGGFLSAAVFSAAPIFAGGRLERWIAGAFIAYGVLGTISVIGFAVGSPIVMIGFLAWGPVLGVAVALLALFFRRASRTGSGHDQTRGGDL